MRNPFVGITVRNTGRFVNSTWTMDRGALPETSALYQNMKVHQYDPADVRAQLNRLMLK